MFAVDPMPPLEKSWHPPWNPSRSKLFGSCPRAFLLATTGLRTTIHPIRKVSSGEAVGIAVHDAIRFHIDRWAAELPASSPDTQRVGQESLEQLTLVESYDRVTPEVKIRESAQNRVRDLVKRFLRFIWPTYQGHKYVCSEASWRFLVGSYAVDLRPDFVSRDPSGRTIVSDWKTYPHAGAYIEDEWVQLAAYILGASTMLGVDPSQVEGRAVSIPTGEVRVIEGSQELMASISARIGTEVLSWRSRSRMSFPPRPAREMCGMCRFLEVCPEGQGVATDRGVRS
jgi:hypothetical protein